MRYAPSMTTEQMAAFSRAVTQCRERRGWSKAELGRRSGMARSTIALIELGRREPSVTTITRLAAALRVSPGRLFKPEPTQEGRPRKQQR